MLIIITFLVLLKKKLQELLINIGFITRMFLVILSSLNILYRRPYLLINQIHFIGNYSLIIIIISGLFVGCVLSFQGYYILNKYGSEEALGLLVALSLTRELSPVLTALLFTGRAGTSLTAEVGLMKAGEQLLAMEMMAVEPLQRIIAPRFLAGIIAMPVLVAIFSAVGIIGGYFIGVQIIGIDEGAFLSQMQSGINFRNDIVNGMLKSIIFGVIVTFIALFQGYEAKPTPEGVAQAITRTVVIASLTVLCLDFLFTALMFN